MEGIGTFAALLNTLQAHVMLIVTGLILIVLGTARIKKISIIPGKRRVLNTVGIIMVSVALILVILKEVLK